MNDWGVTTFGDPCRECEFVWSNTYSATVATLVAVPSAVRDRCVGATGAERHPDLSWSVVAYVCHVSDNFAIWAERLAGVVASGRPEIAPYDQDELAAARRYDEIALDGALWSLEVRTPLLLEAIRAADRAGVTMLHPDRGTLTPLDVTQTVAHDATHHLWDLGRILG